MRKKYIKSPFATFCIIQVVCLSAIFIINGCRKVDRVDDRPTDVIEISNIEQKFFNNNAPINPLVKIFNGLLQKKNEKLKFVEKTVSKIGYPVWNKAITIPKLGTTQGRGNSGDSATLTYIPFVRETENFVNASMIIEATTIDTSFEYLCDWQYSRLPYSTVLADSTAENMAMFFMYFSKMTTGQKEYIITDTLLFSDLDRGGSENRLTFNLVDTNLGIGGRVSTNNIEICIPIQVCTTTTRGFRTPGRATILPGQVCTTIGFNCFTFPVGGDPGGGGIPLGDPGGGTTGGGSGGGGGGGGTPPDCDPGPTGNRTEIAFNCGPGWEPLPIDDDPPIPEDPCAKIDSLKQEAEFRGAFANLESKTNENREYGYRVGEDGFYDLVTGPAGGSNGVNFIVSGNIHFLMHSHFTGGLPIFSGGDFETIKAIYDVNYLKTDKFFFGLSTETGSYVITIENSQKFRDFLDNYIDIPNESPKFEQKYMDYKIGKFSDNNKNIIEFFKLMEKLKTGTSLLKANSDFTEFSKVSVSNNSLVLTPCN